MNWLCRTALSVTLALDEPNLAALELWPYSAITQNSYFLLVDKILKNKFVKRSV